MAFPGEREDSRVQKELTKLMAAMSIEQQSMVIAATWEASRHLFDDADVRTRVALNIAHLIISEGAEKSE